MRSVPHPQNEPGPQPYPLPLHYCSEGEALGRWSEEFVYGLGFLPLAQRPRKIGRAHV